MVARALLVGINAYPGIGNLKGPENDVAAMKDWLTSDEGGKLNPATDITIVTTSACNPGGPPQKWSTAKPVMSQIYDWLDALVEEGIALAGDFPLGDRLYLFFAGHGHHSSGKTAVFMANAWANNLGEAIPMQPLAEYIRSYAFFREVVLIADACREQIDFAPEPSFARKATVSPNAGRVLRFDAFPCPVGLKTKEVKFNDAEGGVLTNAFLTGVRGLAAKNGTVRSESLRSYMINAVEKMLDATPDISCNEGATSFSIAQPAVDRKTHLRVVGAPGAVGVATLFDGLTNEAVAQQDLAAGPIEIDLTPGFYFLRRDGSLEKAIRVAWEKIDERY